MRKNYLGILVFLFSLLITISCNLGESSPITPPQPTLNIANATSNNVLLGFYDISIDPTSLDAEVVPLRGPQFQVNIVKFLQPPAGDPNNLKLQINKDGTNLSEGLVDLTLSITHPFPGTNFRGFDVRGIVIGKATQISKFDYDVQFCKPTELRLLNADGYTRWWNPIEFLTPGLFGYTPTLLGKGTPKSTVNGYKYFADCLEYDEPMKVDIATRGTFSTVKENGDPNTLSREYLIKFPMSGGKPVIQFQYAICASFLPPEPGTCLLYTSDAADE